MAGDPLAPLLARLASLRGFAREVAAESAPLALEAARATAGAGTDPDGKSWPLTKEGKRALPDVAKAISVEAADGSVKLSIGAPYTYQQKTRRILPERMTPRLRKAFAQGAARAWARLTGGK